MLGKRKTCSEIFSLFNFPADIDECALNIDSCDITANCTNTVGSYTCTCNTGYSGDGFTCTGEIQIMVFSSTSQQSLCHGVVSVVRLSVRLLVFFLFTQ